MAEWTFQRRLITGMIVVCLLATLASVGSLYVAQRLVAGTETLTGVTNLNLQAARALQLVGVKEIADVRASTLSGGRESTAEAWARSAQLRESAAELRTRLADPVDRSLLEGVLAAERAHQEAFRRARLTEGTRERSSATPSLESVQETGVRLDQALTAFVVRLDAHRLLALQAGRTALDRAQAILNAFTVLTMVLLVTLCVFIITGLNRSYRGQASARSRAEHGEVEAKATLTQVEAASRLKDEFLATVSHELRNPLAPILTWTQLLRSGHLDEAKTHRALEVIERNVLSQAQLIDDLVDVSRVVSGKFRLDVRPIDLVPVIKAAAESQVPASDAKRIRLQLVLDERAGLISGDSERLQQVMWNLISNAIKFTPKGGSVQVVLQRSESHVEVSVSDSGMGIEPEFLPHVFEPFRQGSGGSMRRHGGLGLGLSIVRHIVELHGGEIVAYSEGPGAGSRFTINFPLLATSQQAGAPLRRHPIAGDAIADVHLGRLDAIRVLVVDDEPVASEALQVLFDSCGAETRVVDSSSEALRTFDTWLPHVMVSDIAMPGEDGYALIRRVRLRSPEQGGTTPAVALTAYAKIEDRVTILAAGFQMYLSKPADPNELVAVVRSLAARGELPVATKTS